jgi:hypothetical protein
LQLKEEQSRPHSAAETSTEESVKSEEELEACPPLVYADILRKLRAEEFEVFLFFDLFTDDF